MKHAVRYVVLALLVAGGFAGTFAVTVDAQQVGGMAQTSGADDYHHIIGFRSASFGMNTDEVRAAIMRDFQAPEDAIEELLNVEQATTVLAVALPSLSPGPGPASVFYIFGATSGELNYINVMWTTSDTPTAPERERIAVAGMQLANYFHNLNWKPAGSVGGVSLNPGEVLTFAGVDPNDAGVQVIISGVPMTYADGNDISVSGPATLQISYSARFGAPDVVTVESGEF